MEKFSVIGKDDEVFIAKLAWTEEVSPEEVAVSSRQVEAVFLQRSERRAELLVRVHSLLPGGLWERRETMTLMVLGDREASPQVAVTPLPAYRAMANRFMEQVAAGTLAGMERLSGGQREVILALAPHLA